MQLESDQGRRFLVIDDADNVATLLDGATDRDKLTNGMPIAPLIPFGHKVCLTPIGAGEAVIKYGLEIGVATIDNGQGEHVHIHNCR